eukprot:c19638_g1_i1.p1 GENE.c19638_g1_i1~~c19638_g1_i1.p1  ORF type:complete len:605 (-),score=171.38 c19638_g1_i1:180-1994(-)
MSKQAVFDLLNGNKLLELNEYFKNATNEEKNVINEFDSHGYTMVHLAAKNGSIEQLKILECNGGIFDKMTKNNEVCSAIHLAAASGQLEVIRFLVENHKIDINLQDALGYTPIAYAAMSSHLHLISPLIQLGADINTKNKEGRGLAHLASAMNSIQLLRVLFELGMNINQVEDESGHSPLTVASSCGYPYALAYLIHHGGDFKKADGKGITPLHWACTSDNISCVTLLVSLGADLNALNSRNETPFHIACRLGSYATVDYFLSLPNLKYNIMDDQMKRPLDYIENLNSLIRSVSNFKTAIKLIFYSQNFLQLLKPSFLKTLFIGYGGGYSNPSAFSLHWIATFFCLFIHFTYFSEISNDFSFYFFWKILFYLFEISAVLVWISYLSCWLSNPGIAKPDEHFIEELFEAVDNESLNEISEKSEKSHLSAAFCKTCHIEKPLRSKHCSVCRKCILMKDHHCAFIGNCVGQNNMIWFILYLIFMTICVTSFIILSFLYAYISKVNGYSWFIIGYSITMIAADFFVISLLGYHFWLLKVGITTNEHSNWYRYPHMKDENGHFRNPFDKGFMNNIKTKLFSFHRNNSASSVSPLISRKNRYSTVVIGNN